MPKKRYIKDKTIATYRKHSAFFDRDIECTVNDLMDSHPVHALEEHIKYWPPHDVRYDPLTMDLIEQRYQSTDERLMEDLAKGMNLKILRRDLTDGIVEAAIEIQTNLDEYERYNLTVQEHNRKWHEAGSPKEIMDPVHGDMIKVKDQYVETVVPDSNYDPEPSSRYAATGPLAKMRPFIKRTAVFLVTYQVKVTGDMFTLGYVAYDPAGIVIYYNEVSNKNLTYLVRRATQEIWGNPNVVTKSGPFLDGISMLIHGEKLGICERDNKKPAILTGSYNLKTHNAELIAASTEQVSYTVLEKTLRFAVPIGLMVGMLCFTWWGLGEGLVNKRPIGSIYFWGMVGIIGALIASRYAALHCDRKVSAIEARKKFI